MLSNIPSKSSTRVTFLVLGSFDKEEVFESSSAKSISSGKSSSDRCGFSHSNTSELIKHMSTSDEHGLLTILASVALSTSGNTPYLLPMFINVSMGTNSSYSPV